jgi:glutamine synthetase
VANIRGMLTLEELKTKVESGEIDTVISAVCDMQGRLIGKRVVASYFVDHLLEHGTHFCTYMLGTDMEMNTPDGFPLMNWESGYGDYLARSDWSTLRQIPWLERTALVFGDVVDEATGELVPVAPRSVLRSEIEKVGALGFAPMMASELEFYVLTDTYEQAHAKGFANLQRFGWYNEDYHLLQATKAEPLYRQFRNQMNEAGVPIEFSKGEAAPGQHEVNIHYADALTSADRAALLKHGCKEIAYRSGYAVTFMAKPDHTWTGSSGHIHVSLWDASGQDNKFLDSKRNDEMSETMRWFLGGMMACAHDFALLFAPNVNSYKRFASASWAPVNIIWSKDNRTCGFRIVGHRNGLRIENRFPGGDANPYLAYAAVLASGRYGIDNKIEPPAEFKGNGYLAKDMPRVPRSLYEAIESWEESDIAKAVFGEIVHAHYLNAARIEQETYDSVVTHWERERYLERG